MMVAGPDSLSDTLSIAAERVGFEPTAACAAPVFKFGSWDNGSSAAHREGASLMVGKNPEGSDGSLSETLSRSISPDLRARVWARDGGICGICHDPVDPLEWNADHILPWVLGGETVVHNLRVTHPRCNRRRGSPWTMTDEQIDDAALEWVQNELAGVWMTFDEFMADPVAAIAQLRDSGLVDEDLVEALERSA